MLGLDTNVLVRLLVADDRAQAARARRLVAAAVGSGEAIFVSLVVLLETEWVLRSRYQVPKPDILSIFSRLLESVEIVFEDEAAIEEALYRWRDASVDFADCLIGARNRRLGCRATATFDSKAAKLEGFIAA